MKVLILGAQGMLGHDLADEFAAHEPALWDKDELDIAQELAVRKKIREQRPDVIINAAAFTDVEGAEQNRDLAQTINGDAVGFIARAAKEVGAIVAHVSTEYVFDGHDQQGYPEYAVPRPVNEYGRSKLFGEQELEKSGARWYVVRTSWLYGKAPQKGKPRGKNFIQTIVEKAKKGEELRVVDDQYGKPSCAEDVAKAIHFLIHNRYPYGIYHAVNEGVTTWHGLACYALDAAGIQAEVARVSSAAFPSVCERPQYAVLLNTAMPPLRPWQDAVREYVLKKLTV